MNGEKIYNMTIFCQNCFNKYEIEIPVGKLADEHLIFTKCKFCENNKVLVRINDKNQIEQQE